MEEIKVLILGANGMLGHKLFGQLSKYENLIVYASVRKSDRLLQHLPSKLSNKLLFNVDAEDFATIISAIERVRPDWVINCIGIVKQGSLGLDPVANISINALLPHRIAQACQLVGSRLLHISTDCVFTGKQGKYREDDVADGLDLYGRSKLLGEVNYPHCLTLRTSIIGHELQSQLGLIEWFMSQKDSIQGYTRHIYSGFPTVELARIIVQYILPNTWLNGIYHLSSEPISKYDLLKLVAGQYGLAIEIKPYEDSFCDRSLDSSRLRQLIDYSPPSWPEMIERMYQDYLNTSYGKKNRRPTNVPF